MRNNEANVESGCLVVIKSRKPGIPAGTYTLTISKTGYYTKTITGFVVNCNRTGLMHYLVKK